MVLVVNFDLAKWTTFLDNIVSKYNDVIKILTKRHSELLKDTTALLDRGTKTLERASSDEQDKNFVKIKEQLVTSRVSVTKNSLLLIVFANVHAHTWNKTMY